MKNKLILCFIAVMLLLAISITVTKAQEPTEITLPTKPEKLISQFIEAKKLNISPDSGEYDIFVKDILWGVYPELSNGKIGEAVRHYAADYVNRGSSLTDEVLINNNNKATDSKFVGYNRQAAVNYAYAWARNGGIKRNPNYPDFGGLDCTNFVSQAVKAGTVPMVGAGDGCRDEGTASEWYSYKVSPPLWCLGSNRNFVWSSAWSVVGDFWYYQTQYTANATSTIYTNTQLSNLRSAAALGDVIQLQDSNGGAKWHSMIVTKKQNGEIYLTYHSSGAGIDVVDNPLANVNNTGSYKYWLNHF